MYTQRSGLPAFLFDGILTLRMMRFAIVPVSNENSDFRAYANKFNMIITRHSGRVSNRTEWN